ncbi:unnamed protein product [Prunus armeniaca]
MEKGIMNIKLMDNPVLTGGNNQKTTSCDHLGSERKIFMIIQALCLSKTFGNKAGFVALDRTISTVFDLVHPLAVNGKFAMRQRSKSPSVIVSKSSKFEVHSLTPSRIAVGLCKRGRFYTSTDGVNKSKMFVRVSMVRTKITEGKTSTWWRIGWRRRGMMWGQNHLRVNEVLEACGGLLGTGGGTGRLSCVRYRLGKEYISRKWCLDAGEKSGVRGKMEIKSGLMEEV